MSLEFIYLVKGLIIGFSIAAPVGPIGILCIQRTITYGRNSGLFTGIGAATADGLYGAIAAFSLTIISSYLVGQQFWLKLLGGAFLLYLGTKTYFSKPAEKVAAENHKGLLSDYLSTFFLTLTNPITILSFVAIFAGLGLGNTNGNMLSAILMVMGVIIGSALWWLILSSDVSLFRKKFNISSLKIVNNISGAIIVVFAIIAFMSTFNNL